MQPRMRVHVDRYGSSGDLIERKVRTSRLGSLGVEVLRDKATGVRSMSRFIVKFMKRVTGDNGYQTEACQFCCDIDAVDKPAAVETAKRQFCDLRRLPDWTLHADRIQALEGDFPS